MISLIAIGAWLFFSARRVRYAESILIENWDELPEEVKETTMVNRRNDLIAFVVVAFFLITDTIALLAQLQQAAGAQ